MMIVETLEPFCLPSLHIIGGEGVVTVLLVAVPMPS